VNNFPENTPQYIDEAEALLGTDFFYDKPRSAALYDDVTELEGEELGARRAIYIGALSVLASAREDERNMAKVRNPDVDVKEWNRNWNITTQRLGTVAIQYQEALQVLARRLVILNQFEQAVETGAVADGLREHQVPYLHGILAGLQHAPAKVSLPNWWERKDSFYIPGVAVTGPTGVGKTAMMARTAVAMGAGTVPRIRGESNGRPVRVLVVTPSQALISQMLGETGKNIFHRLAPGVRLGGYYQYEKQPDADVVFVSIDKFITKFQDGKIDGFPIDALFVDEDHHLTEPEFLSTFLKNWDGFTVGFSATHDYNDHKDSRNTLRHEVVHKKLLEYSHDKVLNDVRMYSLVVHPTDIDASLDITELTSPERRMLRQRAVTLTTRDFVKPLIEEGRRGIIFCEPGNESAHAKDTAACLRDVYLSNGNRIRVGTLGTFQGGSSSVENRQVLDAFNRGEIDVISTTQMAQESLDLDGVTFVIVACKVTSKLKTYQIAGRGFRRDDRFDVTILANINTLGFGQEQYYAQTFASVLGGYDSVVQGERLSRRHTGNWKPQSKIVPDDSSPTVFPANIQNMLDRIDNKEIGRVYTLGDEVVIPDGYLELETIIAHADVTAHNARYRLLRAGYKFVGKTEIKDGKPYYVRYYEPNAQTFFSEKPLPPRDGLSIKHLREYGVRSKLMTLAAMAERLEVNPKVLLKYLKPEEFQKSELKRLAGTKEMRAWEKETGEAILARVKNILVFPAYLVPFRHVVFRVNASYNTMRELVTRLHAEYGLTDVPHGNHMAKGITWEGLQKLENRYGRTEGVEPLDLTKLPADDNDTPERIAYAREQQRLMGVPGSWLPFESESG